MSLAPLGEEKGDPCHSPPTPAQGDDVGSLLSGLLLLEDFGFSKMNLLRRSVSKLAWAPAYASPRGKTGWAHLMGKALGAAGAASPEGGVGTLTSIAGGLSHVLGASDVMPVGAAGQHGCGGAGVGEVLSALVQQLQGMEGEEGDTGPPESPPAVSPLSLGWSSLTLTFFSISSRTLLCCSAMANVALCTRW